jgi:signal transduction histidine kinase
MNGTQAMTDSEFAKSELKYAGKQANDLQYQWLAHELHDGLLQWVVGARMQVESALVKLDKHSPAARNLEQAITLMLNALSEGRSLIAFFENQEVGECDVIKEIANFVESVQSLVSDRGQVLRVEVANPQWPDLPKQHAWSLLRFVQQAVQNAIQHAGPTHIDVRMGWENTDDESFIVASVEDQGVGFDTSLQAPEGHFGLLSLQQRAHMCGGRFELESSPGNGCRVTLLVPA